MHVAAYTRPVLLSHLRVVLTHAGHRLAGAGSWHELAQCLRQQAVDVLVVDPGADGTVRTAELAAIRERYPTLPVTLYTVLSPVVMRAALELSAHGIRHVVLHRFDDEPARFLGLLESQVCHRLSDAILERVGPALTALTLPVARAVERLFRRPDHFFGAEDLAAAAGVTARTLYRQFEAAGLASPRTLVLSGRLLRAYALLRDPGSSIEDVAAKLGYSSPRMFARHMREAVGRTPREVRAHMDDGWFIPALARGLFVDANAAARHQQGAAPTPSLGAPAAVSEGGVT